MPLFLFEGGERRPVDSFAPYLRRSLDHGILMNPELMRVNEARHCRWIHWGVAKGVTHPRSHSSILADMSELTSGMHAQMVQGLPCVDPPDGCYERAHRVHGFGGFIRWVYFAPPNPDTPGVLGIDWSMVEDPNAGVARSVSEVVDVAHALHGAGIADNTELALLHGRMAEYPELQDWRLTNHLVTLRDWVTPEVRMAWKNDSPDYPSVPVPPPARTPTHPRWKFCAECGHKLQPTFIFCPNCGKRIP